MNEKERQAHDELYRDIETRVKEQVKRVAAEFKDLDMANRVGLNAAVHLLAFVVGGIISSTKEKGETVQQQASLVDRKLHYLVGRTLKDAGIHLDEVELCRHHRN